MKQKPIKYFHRPEIMARLFQFSYAVTPGNQMLCAHTGLTAYLGYPPELQSLAEVWHPDEKKKIMRLEQEILDFAKAHSILNGDFGVSVASQMRKADGSYIRVWRHVYPFLSRNVNQETVCAYCMDVSSLCASDKMTFQVVQSTDASFDKEEAQRHFLEVLSDQDIHFTERQLEVLRAWSELDAPKLVAERLNIEVRTLETHLKNARKRLGVRRTMDVVLYAKEMGWL